MGMAFQIIDDILDYEADQGLLRKPTGNDLREGICTLPLICALRRDTGPLRSLMERKDFSAAAVESAIALVKESGGLDEARKYARRYTERALREIEALQPAGPRQLLSALARRMLEREY
jgi:heptaprenyl diphosphate synthase